MKPRKDVNLEMKIGIFIISIFLLWGGLWFFYTAIMHNPFIVRYNLELELLPPFTNFILGSDVHGRSVFELLSSGILYTLWISFSVSIISMIFGVFVGKMMVESAGIIGPAFELITNIVFIMPTILIAIIFVSVFGGSAFSLILTFSFMGWPSYARVTRSEYLRVKNLPYVESARSIGQSTLQIFLKTIFPSILPFLLIQLVLHMSSVIVSESTLGYFGLTSNEYSLGALFVMAKSVLLEAPSLTITLSFVFATLIIGLNLLGDGLRDYFDPHLN